tara:strand:- start:11483 stop:12412 length:930 start_codon:yes stop_codon:yes gene_type:complete
MIWLVLTMVVIVIAAIPLLTERYRTPMTDVTRGGASGQFAELSQGVTHYEWLGPPDGPIAVCIHGLTTPSFAWRAITKGLVSMGYRTLTYDLYGRGYSDRPSGAQDRHFFLGQLEELLDNQNVTEPFTVVGYSMGGSIATCFTAAFPDKVSRLILVASAGMGLTSRGLMSFIIQTPILGDWLMMALFPSIFHRAVNAEQHRPSSVPKVYDMQREQTVYKGYIAAILASRRGILADVLRDEHRSIAAAGIPVLAIWAADDQVIPASAVGCLAEWNRDAKHAVIAGAGHGLPYTHAPEVIEEMATYLQTPA